MFKRLYHKYKSNTRAKQVLGLFAVNIIGIPIGIITSIVLTRYLGASSYGDYKFLLSIFNFSIIIFSFGFFQAGNRALVLNKDQQKAREFYGTELVITFGLFSLMSILLVFYALFDNNIQQKQLSTFLLWIIPLGWIFFLVSYFETLFQADNRIRMLAIVRLYPKVGFFIAAGVIYFIFANKGINKLAVVLFLYLSVEAIVYLFILYKLQPSFRNLKQRFLEIWHHNKSFGLNVYLGSLFILGFSLTEIFISYSGADNSGVGFYSLALTFAAPLSFIPNTIATTHYKEFSVVDRIPKKLFSITIGLSLFSMICLWLLVGPLVKLFYGKAFINVIALNFIVSIGVTAHGLADFFNRYLGANGQGKALRNNAFVVGGSIMLFNLLLIPKWGAYGAAYAKLITGFIYLVSILFYYISFTKKRKTSESLGIKY